MKINTVQEKVKKKKKNKTLLLIGLYQNKNIKLEPLL